MWILLNKYYCEFEDSICVEIIDSFEYESEAEEAAKGYPDSYIVEQTTDVNE